MFTLSISRWEQQHILLSKTLSMIPVWCHNIHNFIRFIPNTMFLTELLIWVKMDLSKNGIFRVSGNLQVYKQLLPLGIDILNNNKAPIKLISEEVDFYVSVGFRLLLSSKCACWEWVGACERDTDEIRWYLVESVIWKHQPSFFTKDTETSLSGHHRETMQIPVYSQLTPQENDGSQTSRIKH